MVILVNEFVRTIVSGTGVKHFEEHRVIIRRILESWKTA